MPQTNGTMRLLKKWLLFITIIIPLGSATFAVHNMYLAIQDTTIQVRRNRVRIDTLEIQSIVTQHTNQDILAEILKKIDPNNAQRKLDEIKKRQNELISQLEKRLVAVNNKKKEK